MRHLVGIEQGTTSFAGYAPDLPGVSLWAIHAEVPTAPRIAPPCLMLSL